MTTIEKARLRALALADQCLTSPPLHARQRRENPAGVRDRLAAACEPGGPIEAILAAIPGAEEGWIVDGLLPVIVTALVAGDLVEDPLPSRAWLRARRRRLEAELEAMTAAGFRGPECEAVEHAAGLLGARLREPRAKAQPGAPARESTRVGLTLDGALRDQGVGAAIRHELVSRLLAALWPADALDAEGWRQRLKDARRRLAREAGVALDRVETGGIAVL